MQLAQRIDQWLSADDAISAYTVCIDWINEYIIDLYANYGALKFVDSHSSPNWGDSNVRINEALYMPDHATNPCGFLFAQSPDGPDPGVVLFFWFKDDYRLISAIKNDLFSVMNTSEEISQQKKIIFDISLLLKRCYLFEHMTESRWSKLNDYFKSRGFSLHWKGYFSDLYNSEDWYVCEMRKEFREWLEDAGYENDYHQSYADPQTQKKSGYRFISSNEKERFADFISGWNERKLT